MWLSEDEEVSRAMIDEVVVWASSSAIVTVVVVAVLVVVAARLISRGNSSVRFLQRRIPESLRPTFFFLFAWWFSLNQKYKSKAGLCRNVEKFA